MDRFDAIIIGMGCGGQTTADRLLAAGKRVAVIERELIGGSAPTGRRPAPRLGGV